MNAILACVATRYRTLRCNRSKYREYQACIYSARQYSRGRFKWVFTSGISCWRINEKDAWNEAIDYAKRNDMECLIGIKPGDSVRKTLLTPEVVAGYRSATQSDLED